MAFRQALYGVSTGTMWHFRGHRVAFPQAQYGVSMAMCGVSSAVWVSCGLGFVCSVLCAPMSCTGVANRSMDSSLVTVPHLVSPQLTLTSARAELHLALGGAVPPNQRKSVVYTVCHDCSLGVPRFEEQKVEEPPPTMQNTHGL